MIALQPIRLFLRSLVVGLVVLLVLALQPAFSQSQGNSGSGHTLAQKLVESAHAQHPEVNELGIAVITSHGCRNIASTDKSDIGEKCETEDLKPMRTGKGVVGKEKGGFDISLPLQDSSGEIVGTVGIELKAASGQTESSAMQRAKQIAADMKEQIPSKASLLQSSK